MRARDIAQVGVALLVGAACASGSSDASPSPSPRPRARPTAASHPARASQPEPARRPTHAAPIEPTITIELLPDGSTYLLHQFRFDLAHAEMSITDLGMTKPLRHALEDEDASLVFNGGFFSPTTAPEGLAFAGGTELSTLDRELGGGIVTVGTDHLGRLHDTADYAQPSGTAFAIQCRPRLIVDGAPNIRSDDGRRADRTVLCLRDGGRTMDLIIARTDDLTGMGGPTLYELSRLLRGRGCRNALNLDGGPSTGVAWRERGGIRSLSSRGPVRHGVAVRLARAR